MPEALAITSLAATKRVPRAALGLRWIGRGAAPLRVRLWVTAQPGDFNDPYEIECLLEDDGEFELPAAVLAAAPEGFVTAEFERAERKHSNTGDKRLLTIARVNETHHFALGERCERPEALAACERYAEHLAQVYEDCGGVPVPPLAETCPAYLSESCRACPEYFDCLIASTSCHATGPGARQRLQLRRPLKSSLRRRDRGLAGLGLTRHPPSA